MSQFDSTVSEIDLSLPQDSSPLRVSLESFFELSFWIAEELEDLVASDATGDAGIHLNCSSRVGSTSAAPPTLPANWESRGGF